MHERRISVQNHPTMRLRALPLCRPLLIAGSIMGQHKRQEQEESGRPAPDLYLPVECLITANGGLPTSRSPSSRTMRRRSC